MNNPAELASTVRYLSVKQVAHYLNVSKKFIEKHVATGRVPGVVKVGRLLRFDREAIDRRMLGGQLLLGDRIR